jgi:carboxypeptidase D
LENAGKSVNGRNLWYMKAGARIDSTDGGPRTLLIANMHGDESAGRELMIYLLRDLLAGYGKDERITRILNGSQVFIMPSMNPDGFEDRQRWNANYKDLNRSFPDFTDDPDDRTTGRPPEVAAVMGLHDRYAFSNSLNFHGGEVCFNMPWDTQSNRDDRDKFGDDSYMNSLARAYTSTNRTMLNNDSGTFDRGVTYGYEWYEVNGGMQDWSIVYRESTHATIELSYAKFVSENNLATVWNENRESLLDFLDRSTLGVHLNVVDAATGNTLSTSVEVRTSNAPRSVKFRDGLVHRLTPAGSHKVTIKAAGYTPATLDIDAARFSGSLRTVRLDRL